MHPRAVIAGNNLQAQLALMIALGPAGYAADVIEAERPLQSLVSQPVPAAAAAVVMLTGSENVADLRALLDAHPKTRFVFLAPQFPPSPAMARIVDEHQGVVLRLSESPVVVAATLVAMLATIASGASA